MQAHVPLYPYTTCTCTCRCRAVKALALNAPLFIQPFLETISRFSFYNVVRQAVPDFDYPLTVEKFPGVETASRLVQIESLSTQLNRRLRTQVSDTSMSASLIT